MSSDRSHPADDRRRDLAVYRYVEAFDDGDLDALAAVLAEAELDAELDRRVVGVNAALHAEAGLQSIAEHAQVVRRLLLQHLPSGFLPPAPEPGPLVVGDVAARLQADQVALRVAPVEDREANRRLLGDETPVPVPLTEAALARLVTRLGITAGQRYWEAFRRTAIVLAMARQRGQAELAAARRQNARPQRPRTARNPSRPEEEQR